MASILSSEITPGGPKTHLRAGWPRRCVGRSNKDPTSSGHEIYMYRYSRASSERHEGSESTVICSIYSLFGANNST